MIESFFVIVVVGIVTERLLWTTKIRVSENAN